MRFAALAACALTLSACASSPEEIAARRAAERERALTQRFAVCMDRTLGKLKVFASEDARLKAAATCNDFAKSVAETDE